MQNLIPLILVGFFMYLIFKKGGVGCCGGHSADNSEDHDNKHSNNSNPNLTGQIIDLHENEYVVIESKENKLPRVNRND